MRDFADFKKEIQNINEWLQGEFLGIQTGRVTPAILDKVLVEAYGARMGIREIASISVEDPRTLRIAPYDMSQAKAVEKAIIASDLGLSVSADDKGVRAIAPELTAETRTILVKTLKGKLEDAKISLRKKREEVWQKIQDKEKRKEISEDDKYRFKEEMQKLTEDAGQKLEEMAAKKEKDILS